MSIRFIIIFHVFILHSLLSSKAQQCHENQKLSLLKFKNESFADSFLQTWKPNTNCCSWSRVKCNTSTGHVIGLQLSYSGLQANLFHSNSSLFDIVTLRKLDLSFNEYFSNSSSLIPSAFETLSNLTHLTLPSCGFSGKIPLELSRLTRLISLDLSYNYGLYLDGANDLKILIQNMTQLEELRLNSVHMSSVDWSTPLSHFVPYLHTLSCYDCSISGEVFSSLSNLSFLSFIKLPSNNLSTEVPKLFGDFTSLRTLDLWGCELLGEFPESILKLPHLEFLDLSLNENLNGSLIHLPNSIDILDVSFTNFKGILPEHIGNFHKLTYFGIENCYFSGKIPNGIRKLSELVWMDLSSNNFHGPLPSFENCFLKLEYLDITDNLFDGAVPLSFFTLPLIRTLWLGNNRFMGLTNEIPRNLSPFTKLQSLSMSSCGLSQFPSFLQNIDNLERLDLSNNQISGPIPTWKWFGNLTLLDLSHNLLTYIDRPLPDAEFLEYLDLSSNNLNGSIPLVVSRSAFYLDYSNNNFTSIIPTNISSYLSTVAFFSVSKNQLVGYIPESFCSSKLEALDLSNNKLSGNIPTCLGNFSQDLMVLNLGGNRFWGEMPSNYTKSLRSIVFHGNRLNGTVPRSLSDCMHLEVLDLGNNQISDTFPFWLDNLPHLRVLVLRSNNFNGHIGYAHTETPFPKLHVIDISSNRFTGLFPSEYVRKWKGMTHIRTGTTVVKYLGSDYYYDPVIVTNKDTEMVLSRTLTIFSSFDVSNNNLEGVIGEFGDLKSLIVLNLSRNGLVGSIPSSLEKLSQLESLDLSRNKLSGEIPQSLTSLTFLAVLDLSRNRLEGRIPQGRQFDTFPISSYEGNEGLCGYPLDRKCSSFESVDSGQTNDESGSESVLDWKFALMGFGSGLVAGLSTGYVFVLRNNGCFKNTTKRKRECRFQRR